MSVISADRMNKLKAAVKAECQRRNKTGSVSAYGGTNYDFSVTPAAGGTVRKEHYEKIAVPLNAINAANTPATDGARIVDEDEIAAMEAKTTLYAARSYYNNTGTDCSASCTGLCYSCTSTCTGGCGGCGGCGDACTGCTGCGDGCTGCTGTCSGSCTGCSGCGGCDTGCSGGCTGCNTQCFGCYGCGSGCAYACDGGCQGGCYAACANGCSSCSGGCGSSCTGTCSGGASN